MSTAHRSPATAIIALGFVAWALAFIARSSFPSIAGPRYFCLFDDAMISMRYAWNLAHGFGLTWNPPERIEGYTNLLMTLFMAPWTRWLDKRLAVLAVQLSGVAFMLGIAWCTRAIARELTAGDDDAHRAWLGRFAFLGALAYYPLAYWSLMGMETGLLTLLLLASVVVAMRADRGPARATLVPLGALSGLACLTRPDAIVVSAIVIAGAIRARRRTAFALGLIAVTLLFPLGQLLFRLAYYDAALPNTYLLKVEGMPLLPRVQGGARFLRPFLYSLAIALPVALAGLRSPRDPRRLLLLAPLAGLAAYQLWAGGDPWRYWRIVAPAVPLLVVLFGDQAFRLARRARRGARAAWLFGLAGLVTLNAQFLDELSFRRLPYTVEYNRNNVNAALALDAVTTPAATIGVFWAGSIPYYTGRRAHDFLGKTDRRLSALPPDLSGATGWNGMKSVPGHNKYDLDYSIRKLAPTFVQAFVWGRDDLRSWAPQAYVRVRTRGVELYLRRDAPEVKWDRVEFLPFAGTTP